MSLSETIFIKLEHVRQFSIKNAYTEPYENSTDILVADTGSRTDERTPYKASLLLREESLKRKVRIRDTNIQDELNSVVIV